MAQAKNSGRRGGGIMKVRKARQIFHDGAHGMHPDYQAQLAQQAADQRDAERTAESAQEAQTAAERARLVQEAAQAAAEAQRQAQLSSRPCLRCKEVLPPEAFERHARAYNGRVGCCRPCAKLIRDRKTVSITKAPVRTPRPRPCLHCETRFVPSHHNVRYCSDECRATRQTARHAAQHQAAYLAQRETHLEKGAAWKAANPDKRRAHRRKAYHADPEAEKAAHGVWVEANRDHINAYQREWRQKQKDKQQKQKDKQKERQIS